MEHGEDFGARTQDEAKALDRRIDRVNSWILVAGEALLTFYEEDARRDDEIASVFAEPLPAFRRNTLSQARGATSTGRSFVALAELAYVMAEDGVEEEVTVPFDRDYVERPPQLDLKVVQTRLAALIEGHLCHLGGTREQQEAVRGSQDNGVNIFTDSFLTLSALIADALVQEWTSSPLPRHDLSTVTESMPAVLRSVDHMMNCADGPDPDGSGPPRRSHADRFLERRGAALGEQDSVHDFLTLSALRAYIAIEFRKHVRAGNWSCECGEPSAAVLQRSSLEHLRHRVHSDVLRQLGCYNAGVIAPFDPVELSFSLTLLDRLGAENCEQLTTAGIKVLQETQTPDGSWPIARMVSQSKQHLLHIASPEVGLALACIALEHLERGEAGVPRLLMPLLDKCFRLVQDSFTSWTEVTESDGDTAARAFRGWANDRTRTADERPTQGRRLIESWATAGALMFLVRYRAALLGLRQHDILQRYETATTAAHGASADTPSRWADLHPMLRVPRAVEPLRVDDPTDEGQLAAVITSMFLAPVSGSWTQRPDAVSMVMPGPPGSGKTTFVMEMARALRWPLVTLSPPDFLRDHGLDGFEAAAANVFSDLMRLRRVVVLFDECEDFFRSRGGAAEPAASRTIGAFITSGMLPRLQRLRDNRWVIFCLATNGELSDLDSAAIRPGRFDFALRLDHPSGGAQRRYLDQALTGNVPDEVHSAVLQAVERYAIGRTRALEEARNNPSVDVPPALTWQVLRRMKAFCLEGTLPGGTAADPLDQWLTVQARSALLGPPSLIDLARQQQTGSAETPEGAAVQ